ncbi:carboxypeptidase-like regulatory domain-containing protein [Planctomicrobium sp. SH668]|uniref:carboxypeptidase-like regulatory domain-containing protein n=1 Tax=Planctomicrobium sp. SH668 TaxID=3448126 RepID=UPI003F5C9EEC
MKFSLGTTVALIGVLFFGCGGSASKPVGAIGGKVILNGKPVPNGVVTLSSAALGTGATAKIKEDGTYQLSEPIPAGDYSLAVSGIRPTPMNPNPPATDIPKKYWIATTSGLKFSIKPGMSTYDIDLAGQPEKKKKK